MFSLDNVLQRKSDVANVSQPALRVLCEAALQHLSEWTRDRFPIRLVVSTAAIVSDIVSPTNGVRRVNISYRTMPKDQM